MNILSLDHIVLVVKDVAQTCTFYQKVLGMEPVEHPAGKWGLRFGSNKISLQAEGKVPPIASQTARGGSNFCLLTDTPIAEVVQHLQSCEVEIIDGPVQRDGALGPILSVYFYDPDGNLVEVCNQIALSNE